MNAIEYFDNLKSLSELMDHCQYHINMIERLTSPLGYNDIVALMGYKIVLVSIYKIYVILLDQILQYGLTVGILLLNQK